jgi:opacity protein-like surface antigen
MRRTSVAAIFLIGCLLALVAAPAAIAQEAGGNPQAASPAGAQNDDGQRFELAFLAGGGPGTVKDSDRTSTNLTQAIVRFGFNLPKVGGGRRGSTFGVLIEMVPYFSVDQEPRATGAGVVLLFRYMYAGEHWRPMITLGTGIVKTDETVPPGEVTKNFTPQGGLGLQYMFNPALGIDIEYRFHHMSNNSQTDNNPGIDTQMVLFGLAWSF